jgi:2-hydroxychromene-2-carboxylate isomerase
MKRKLRSLYLAVILDQRFIALKRMLVELRRQLTFKKRVVHVFVQLDDPYSYLLSHYLGFVMQRYKRVEFRFYLCQALRGDFAPEPALQAEHAVADCRMLAAELGVPFLDRGTAPTVDYRRPLLDFLADEHDDEDFPQTLNKALTVYWRGDTEGVEKLIGQVMPEQSATNVLIGKHQLLLRKMGHYNCATMHYAGEWYWGIDRLLYLTDRFAEQGLDRYSEKTPELEALVQVTGMNLPVRIPAKARALPPLEMFCSFRSPYSYIALARTFEIADAFGLKLVVRPVLPMVMRGLSVPKAKLLYIVRDANREAKALNLPFGKFADPLGSGSERCMAVFYHAQKQGRERKFLLAAGEAIWSRGIDVATDEGMEKVAKRAGLAWPEVQQAMQGDEWREAVEANREALTEVGLWGVPSFRIGKLALWGQDRIWLLARRIAVVCRDPEDTA